MSASIPAELHPQPEIPPVHPVQLVQLPLEMMVMQQQQQPQQHQQQQHQHEEQLPQHQLLVPEEPPIPPQPQRQKQLIEYPFPPGDVNLEEHPPTAIQKRWIIQQMEQTKETSYSLARKLNCKSGYIRKLMFRERKNNQYQFRDDAGRPKALDDISETAILTNVQQRAGELSTADAIALLNQEYQATLTRRDPNTKVKKMPARTRKRYLERLCPETVQNKKQNVAPPPQTIPLRPAGVIGAAIHPVVPLSIPGGVGGVSSASSAFLSSSSSSSSSSASSSSLSQSSAVAFHTAELGTIAIEAHNQSATVTAVNQFAMAQAYTDHHDHHDNTGYHSM